MRYIIFLVALFFNIVLFSQGDTVKIGLNHYVITDNPQNLNIDSLLNLPGKYVFTPQYYKERYIEKDLMYKVVDNKGNGFDSLYGTRNMRPVLHGVAYRGGANNHYHLTEKRHNHNPIPLDGMHNLCAEGFSNGIYLYRKGFENYPLGDTCQCRNEAWNNFKYHQYDYFDSAHIYKMMEMTYLSATNPNVGPVYLHCWNGWHASGFISALMLKQFCSFSNWDAVNYWDIGTDGANQEARYQKIREDIKKYEPYPEFLISDSLQKCLCPPMPEKIDSSKLHIEIEHLVVVPEAIPVGFQIVLYNVRFAPGKTSITNLSSNVDIINVMKALDSDPNLKIEIGGYTDNSGGHDANVQLSRERAKYIYDYLIKQGYSADRISYQGYGPKNPIYSNKYKSTREGNRRIEVKVIEKTIHSNDKLVDEGVKVAKTKEVSEKAYITYFFTHPEESLQSNFIIDSLQFESGSSLLPAEGKGMDLLDELVVYLSKNKNIKITINGYTDASGFPENNLILSEERAKAVYDYLIQKGINPNRLIYRGHGDQNPIATNTYLWGRDMNRRIEIEFVGD